MKFLGKLIVALLVAVLVVIIGLYVLLQTRWGAAWITDWVNAHSDYHITFDEMDHSLSSPSHVMLKNVTFGRKGQPATLVAQNVDIGLSTRSPTRFMSMRLSSARAHSIFLRKPPRSRSRQTVCN